MVNDETKSKNFNPKRCDGDTNDAQMQAVQHFLQPTQNLRKAALKITNNAVSLFKTNCVDFSFL